MHERDQVLWAAREKVYCLPRTSQKHALAPFRVLYGPWSFQRYTGSGVGAREDQPGSCYSCRDSASETREDPPKRSRQIKPIFGSQEGTSKPKWLENEVPPRRGRDLILLPHVLPHLGTPRQAWNEVKPLATPDAGTSSRVSRLAEPMSQA